MYKNYDDIDDNYNSVPSLEIAIKIWTPFKEIKNKKVNSFLFPPANLIYCIKNLHQTPAWKNSEIQGTSQTGKTKNWVPEKSRKIITERNQRKWKKNTSKQNKEGAEGSSSEKKNVKCQDKEHENVFENNLTGPNE